MRLLSSRLLFASAILLAPTASLALVVTPTNDAFGLANTLFLNTPGLSIQGASSSGGSGQLGTYQNTSGTLGLPLTGIVMSSGNISSFGSTSYDTAATDEQNALLNPITGQSSHFDVAQLDIDFFAAANVNSVTFFISFGSREWPNFVNDSFTDGFGLFVNGTNVAGVQPTGGGPNLPVNINHPNMVPVSTFGGPEDEGGEGGGEGGGEFEVFESFSAVAPDPNFPFTGGVLAPNGNPVIRFDVPVNSGAQNAFTIIIADASDTVLDTGVFISSFFPTDGGGGGVGVGSNEFNPILPSNPPDPITGAFVIELPDFVPDNQIVWIDPPVSTGFVYELTGTGTFATIVAPSLASVADLDGYFVTVGGNTVSLAAGGSLDLLATFGLSSITSFTITGINPSLGLDPLDGMAFPLGVSFIGLGPNSFITQTPIVENTSPVPLPAAGWLMLAGIGGLAVARRRRKIA